MFLLCIGGTVPPKGYNIELEVIRDTGTWPAAPGNVASTCAHGDLFFCFASEPQSLQQVHNIVLKIIRIREGGQHHPVTWQVHVPKVI